MSTHGFPVPGGAVAHESRVGFRRVSSLLCVSSVGFRGVSSLLGVSPVGFRGVSSLLCVSSVGFRGVSSLLGVSPVGFRGVSSLLCVSPVGFRGFMMISQFFSAQLFVAMQLFVHADHAHRVFRWSWSAASSQTARLLLPWPRVRARRVGRPSRRTEWRQGLGQLIDAMDRSVEDLGPEPPAWWRHGQPMQLTMATVTEYVVVQEDIVMAAVAEPAGDEPAAACGGAGDDKPAEPCTKRRKTHMLPEVKEWF